MPAESVYPDLEPLLPRVRKPIQYVGGEVGSVVKDWDGADVRWALCYPDAYEVGLPNQGVQIVRKPIQYVGGEVGSVVKDWDGADVRWALCYPDAYEVGLPNQGVQILYEVLNERDRVLAERTYTVWPDLEALMREHGVPQFTVDSHRPVGAFDVLGLSFATEMAYTNLLTVLDLAGIPLYSSERAGSHPLVIAGGHAAFNPEPVADFLDAVVLGDGEQAVLAITDVIRDWKRAGRPGGRDGLLLRLSGIVYVPRFYDVTYHADGRISNITPNRPGVSPTVSKHTVMDLDAWPYPRKPIVPVAETVHERYSVEIFRGCVAASGFSEVGLLSLSGADHSEINEIAVDLADCYEGSNVGLSLPSTRVDAFNVTLADELSRNGRRSGLTFAPEGGSERMRKVINKMVTEEDLIRTVTTAYSSGWRQVKLYFMCGLPTETDADVMAIAQLARKVIAAGREATGRRDIRCTVSIGGFVPKPHTPFQWAAQCPAEVVDARLRALGGALRADRGYGKSIGYRYHDGQPGLIEGLLSRGDRRVGAVILAAWREPRLRQVDRVPLPRRAARPDRGAAVPRRPPGGRRDPGGVAGRSAVRRLERVLLVRALAAMRGRGAGRGAGGSCMVHYART